MAKQQYLEDSEYIIIPNPIYDVVFRYLMSDKESAIIVLSTLIGEKITKIEFDPLMYTDKKINLKSEKIEDPKTKDDLKLFHLDFVATVELPDGREELIMIELQKASQPNDIFRFKRYISKNFQKKQEVEITNPQTKAIEVIDKPIRLIPIFILNFRIEKEINDLLIKINRTKKGVFKNKELTSHNEFIDHLSYDMWVIQLPNLSKVKKEDYENNEYKSKLYALLKLFDQKSKVRNNEHRLRLIRKFFPGFLDRVLRRLQAASINNPDLEEQMYVEDDYLNVLTNKDNKISLLEDKLDETKEELDETKEKLDNTKGALDMAKQSLLKFAKMLKNMGTPTQQIMAETNLSKEEIEAL